VRAASLTAVLKQISADLQEQHEEQWRAQSCGCRMQDFSSTFIQSYTRARPVPWHVWVRAHHTGAHMIFVAWVRQEEGWLGPLRVISPSALSWLFFTFHGGLRPHFGDEEKR
jgi:hypothetical protein